MKPILGAVINTAGVMVLIQLLKRAIPSLRASSPWLLPILAAAAGPAIAQVQTALASWLGVPIDLSPLAAIATGASAVAVHQVYRQARG